MNPKKDFSILFECEKSFNDEFKRSDTSQAVAITCSDGVHKALDAYAYLHFGLLNISKVVKPGIEKYLYEKAHFQKPDKILEEIYSDTLKLTQLKKPPALLVASHMLCAGNVVDLDHRIEQTYAACENIAHFWTDLDIQRNENGERIIIGLLIAPNPMDTRPLYGGREWIVKEICKVPMKDKFLSVTI